MVQRRFSSLREEGQELQWVVRGQVAMPTAPGRDPVKLLHFKIKDGEGNEHQNKPWQPVACDSQCPQQTEDLS